MITVIPLFHFLEMFLQIVICKKFFYLFIRKAELFIIANVVCCINFEVVQSCKDTFFGNPETSCQYSKLQIIIRLQRLAEQSPNQ